MEIKSFKINLHYNICRSKLIKGECQNVQHSRKNAGRYPVKRAIGKY
jgi:hypothetical protein